MTHHLIYVNGRVRIMKTMCSSCIFRPGNLMHLEPGRVKEMVADARQKEGTVVCHETLDKPLQAACRGFVDRHATQPLQVAQRLGLVEDVEPPESYLIVDGG